PTWYFAGDQFTEVTDLVPGDNAGLDRFEQIGLLVHDGLLLERGDHAIRPRNDRIVEFPPRPRHRALRKHALVAGDDRGDVLAGGKPRAEQHRDVASRGEADQ